MTVAFTCASRKEGRVGGVSMAQLHTIASCGRFDACVVKADGARGRLIKAPAEYEPVLPEDTATLIPEMVEAVTAHLTLGEIMGTIRTEFGYPYDPFEILEGPVW